jgi:hypothetical protein
VSSSSQSNPRCGVTSVTGDTYGIHLSSTSGEVGGTIAVYGTTLRGEDGRFAPSQRLEVWWNAQWPNGQATPEPFRAGPVVLLAVVNDMDHCRFRTAFDVPNVPPGVYEVRAFVFMRQESGLLEPVRFTVK